MLPHTALSIVEHTVADTDRVSRVEILKFMRSGGHDENSRSRPAVGRPALDDGDIIEAALGIVDEGGAEALSMRSLAQQMGSSTATIYRHFPNRAALIIGVIDRVMAEVELDARDFETSWREACGRLSRATFEALGRHRHVAPLLAEHPPIGRHAMNLREHFFAVMLHHQFPPETAAPVTVMLARGALGFATQFVAPPATMAQIAAALHGATMNDFPATASLAHLLPVGPVENSFDLWLELTLDGLERLRENEGISGPDE